MASTVIDMAGLLWRSSVDDRGIIPFRPAVVPSRAELFRQVPDNSHRFQADAHHLADEAHDVLLVVGPVGVGTDAAAFVLADLILVDDPLQGAAVAELADAGEEKGREWGSDSTPD